MKRYLTIFTTDTTLNTLPFRLSRIMENCANRPIPTCTVHIAHVRIMCIYTSCIENLLYPYRLGTKLEISSMPRDSLRVRDIDITRGAARRGGAHRHDGLAYRINRCKMKTRRAFSRNESHRSPPSSDTPS